MLGELKLELPASQLCFTGWDFEGIDKYPVEIGVTIFKEGNLHRGFFSRLFAPKDLIIPAKSPMFGYDLHKNQDSPKLWELWPQLSSYWQVHCFVGHNIGTERKYLHAFPLHPAPAWLDTLKLFRFAYPHLPSHTLGDLLREFQLVEKTKEFCKTTIQEEVSEHNPLYDAAGCLLLLNYLLNQPGWEQVTLSQLQSLKPEIYYKNRKRSSPTYRFQRSF